MPEIFRKLIFIMAVFFLMSCTRELNVEEAGFGKSYRTAKEKFNKENYTEALTDLNRIILNYGGENGIDSVQFMIARCHYLLDEFYSASYEFQRLAESFPESKLAEESYFNDAECYYQLSPRYTLDQADTETALSKYQLYLDLFPEGRFKTEAGSRINELREKMARKEYEAGVLYLKLDQPRAAKVYFLGIIDSFYDTSFYIPSLELASKAFFEMGDEYNYHIYHSKFMELTNKDAE